MINIVHDVEVVAGKIRDGFVAVFHAIEHEVPAILALLVNVYGPDVVAHAIATYQGNVTTFADKEAAVAEADVKALVQSSVVEKFHLPPTAAQLIATSIHHLFTIGEDKMNTLIAHGATAAIASTGTSSPSSSPS